MSTDGFVGLGNRVQRRGSADLLAEEILNRIVEGEIPPGTPLRESMLARESGLARNTVREAIRILVADGLVQHYPNKGAAVCKLDGEDVMDLYRVRLMAELEGIRSVARLTPGQEAAFEQSLQSFEAAAGGSSASGLVAADLHFHTLLVDLAGSPRLDRLYRSILNEVRFGFSLLTAADREIDNPRPLVDEHRAIYESLVAGDGEACAALLTEHLGHYKRRMVDLVRQRAAEPVGASAQ